MKSIIKSLSAVQKALSEKGISKAQENKFDNYKFRGIDDVLNALAPILADHGVMIIPSVKNSEIRVAQTSTGKPTNHCKVEVEYTLYDSSGESVSHTFTGEGMDRGDKSMNKACTAAFKYFLFEAFCIPVEGTPDADSESHEIAERLTSDDDLNEFNAILKAEDIPGFLSMKLKLSDDQMTELFNTAEHGQITKRKAAIRKLEKTAFAQVEEYKTDIGNAVALEDLGLLRQLGEELDRGLKVCVYKGLSPEEQNALSDVMTQKEAA